MTKESLSSYLFWLKTCARRVLTLTILAAVATILASATPCAHCAEQWPEDSRSSEESQSKSLSSSENTSDGAIPASLERAAGLFKEAETTYNEAVEARQSDQKDLALEKIEVAISKIDEASNLLDELESDENASKLQEYGRLRIMAFTLRHLCMDLFQEIQLNSDDSGVARNSAAAPLGFGHYLRVLGEVFYSPKREKLTPEERASYDNTLCSDETKFEFVCRVLKEQRETRPQAFWSFLALFLVLILFCTIRVRKRRTASEPKESEDASEAKEGEDSVAKDKE